MRSYRLKAKAKLGAEVNVSRILQAFNPAEVHSTELRQVRVDSGPGEDSEMQKTEVRIGSRRRNVEEEPAPDYEMRCLLRSGTSLKPFLWKGKSDDSNKFAVAYVEGNEVRMSLVDHWYKFTRAAEFAAVPRGSGEVGGRENKGGRRKRNRREAEDDEPSEEMDFVEEFADDDEDGEPLPQDYTSAERSSKLTASGKAIKRALHDTEDSVSISSHASSAGLEDSSSDSDSQRKKTLTKELFIRELERLGKVKKRELVERMSSKFELREKDEQRKLGEYLRRLTNEFTEGSDIVYVLKEDVRLPRRR